MNSRKSQTHAKTPRRQEGGETKKIWNNHRWTRMDTARHRRNQRREDHHGLHPPSPRLRRASKISQIEKRRTKRKMNLNSRTQERITMKINYEKETTFL
jgi:hypothetical protein